jgi:hypothetical protein
MGLKNLNGWQRLWVVVSVCLFLALSGWRPLEDRSKQQSILINLYQDAYGDFDQARCLPYQTQRFSTLTPTSEEDVFKPGSCSHIWRKRRDSSNPDDSYTKDDFDEQINESLSKTYKTSLYFGTLIAAVLSVLVYVVGMVVGWIAKGFKGS